MPIEKIERRLTLDVVLSSSHFWTMPLGFVQRVELLR
jgi:hypothetical protein